MQTEPPRGCRCVVGHVEEVAEVADEHVVTVLAITIRELQRNVTTDPLHLVAEEEVRLRLVSSKTTLLGLVKHVSCVEGVWFDQAVTGRTSIEAGIASTPDRSFTITASDTIASVQASYRRRCEASRRTMADLGLDVRVSGRGDRPVWALQIQVLRELAQHTGHADILREQVLALRNQQRPDK